MVFFWVFSSNFDEKNTELLQIVLVVKTFPGTHK